MPDDGHGKNDETEHRGSLVERAMRRASIGRKPGAALEPDDGRQLSSTRPVAEEHVRQSPSQDQADTNRGDEGVDSLPERTVTTLPQVDDEPRPNPVPAAPRRGQSRQVELDFEAMQARGFITPNRTRTRTTEEFRLIKRSVLQGISAAQAEGRRNPNLVMITSAGPAEGKTFNTINLAISIASEPDLNTLLIDADLVKPNVFQALGIEPGRGLIDIIESSDNLNMADVLVRTNVEGLTLLSAGTPHPMATELMASERMKRFVDEVAQRYKDRIVIFDAPPILATSEASVLSEHMSQIVFIVEADRTSRNQAKEALDMIGTGPRVGIVLNKVSSKFGVRQFGGYYKSYSPD